MFSGIIECSSEVIAVESLKDALRIQIKKPSHFDDLKVGDSIAVDGVCLTLEDFSENNLFFIVGFETLKILNRKDLSDWLHRKVNLERSLKWGDRIHGHLVTGHVEAMGQVLKSEPLGENWILQILVPSSFQGFVWPKGSLTINGTSLTLNDVKTVNSLTQSLSNLHSSGSATTTGSSPFPTAILKDDPAQIIVEHCLIPETQKRTNLSGLKRGDTVCLESDYMVKVLFEGFKKGVIQSDV